MRPVTVYISIGNSDDKLSQKEWSQFYVETATRVAGMAKTLHGTWFSSPVVPWQNACWCVEFHNQLVEAEAREVMKEILLKYRQDSVAWATVVTEFIPTGFSRMHNRSYGVYL